TPLRPEATDSKLASRVHPEAAVRHSRPVRERNWSHHISSLRADSKVFGAIRRPPTWLSGWGILGSALCYADDWRSRLRYCTIPSDLQRMGPVAAKFQH